MERLQSTLHCTYVYTQRLNEAQLVAYSSHKNKKGERWTMVWKRKFMVWVVRPGSKRVYTHVQYSWYNVDQSSNKQCPDVQCPWRQSDEAWSVPTLRHVKLIHTHVHVCGKDKQLRINTDDECT